MNKVGKTVVKGLFFTAVFLGVLIISGCGQEVVQDNRDNFTSVAGTVQLYHATKDGVEPDEERYQLKQPDNLSAAILELIDKMQLDPRLKIETYSIDENRNITLFLNGVEEFTEEEKLLNEAAIVRSIQGLQAAGNVEIVLHDKDGQIIDTASFTDSSFYYYNMGD